MNAALTNDVLERIVQKHVKLWFARFPDAKMQVEFTPTGWPNLPDNVDKSKHPITGGVHIRFGGAYRIGVCNKQTRESILTGFFHELGHATYEFTHPGAVDEVDSEAFAFIASLEGCVAEGYEDLAYHEASIIKNVRATEEPYRSAVAKLEHNPVWRKYARLDETGA